MLPTRRITRTWVNEWEITGRRRSLWRRLSAPQLFVGSFFLLIASGTLGLKLLPGLYVGEELSWLDALFTATSAVCVTGLSVEDTATFFTPAGQLFILLLIQLGGLGIITFTTLIILVLGRRLSLRQEAFTASAHEVAPHVDLRHLTRDVVLFTFVIEAAGALLLYGLWAPRLGVAEAAWPALFHAISAFCNAGFSTFSGNLIPFQRDPGTLLVVAALIVLGGLGFLTMEEVYLRYRVRRRQRARLSLHSRLVLGTTAILLLAGWVMFSFFEWRLVLAELPVPARLANALFLSVTPRTAGFNSIDYSLASDSTNFLTILLMTVGGSPGSMAGGLKTTTFALVGLLAWSRFRGTEVTSIWGRSVREETIQRAVGLFVVMFGLVTLAIFVLIASEIGAVSHVEAEAGFLKYMFEAVSALNTVGLSMGVSPTLSGVGKAVIILLMFLGRVGPLTFAAAIALRARTPGGEFRYAYEEVVIG